jgi:sigma-B regulation protein RsbU (phosphoserine phosphatase)
VSDLHDDLELFYHRAPCGFLSTAPDGLIADVNQTFLTWTGFPRESLVGKRRLVELLSVGGRLYHDTHYLPMLLMQDHVREIAVEVVCADRRRLPVLLNAALDRDEEGLPTMIRVVILDSRERREYERELLRAKVRAEESEQRARTLVQTLQQTLIPPVPPTIAGLDVAAAYRPAGSGDEVGGDFFDVFQIGEDDWMVTLGDVSGKGVEAAVVTALIRHTLRSVAVRYRASVDMLHELNRVMLESSLDRFCTVALMRMRRTAGVWYAEVTLGGQSQPLLRSRGQRSRPFGRPGSLVGALDDPGFFETRLRLAPGDTVVLYTDGVTEGRHGGEFYGDQRLMSVVDTPRADVIHDLADRILADVLAFQDGQPRDDIAVLTLQVPKDAPA